MSSIFAFNQKPQVHDDLNEVTLASGTFSLLLHQASRGHRLSQSYIKIVFDVEDIEGFGQEGVEVWLDLQGSRLRLRECARPIKESYPSISQGIPKIKIAEQTLQPTAPSGPWLI